MGKSKKSPTQTTTNVPFSGQQPFLIDSFNQAKNLFDQGPQQYFPGATTAGQGFNTQNALNKQAFRASAGSPVTRAAQGFAQGVLQNSPQFGGAQSYQGQGGGFQDFSQQAGAGNALSLDQANQQFQPQLTGINPTAQGQLDATARGENLTGNPFLDQTFNQAADRITDQFTNRISPQIAAQFSQAGRTGSSAALREQLDAADSTGDALANLGNQIYGGNYQQERGRQLQAANQLGSLGQNQQGLRLQAAGQGANLFGQSQGQDIQRLGLGANLSNADQGRALQAAGIDAGVFGQQLGQQNTVLGQANSLANQDYTDLGRQLQVGQINDANRQQELDAAKARFDFQQQAPQTALANYIAAIQGNYGGTTTTSSKTDRPGSFQRAAGGALAGSSFGLPGAIIGGLGGLFG